ncbi:MAG: rhodanese-like domain-containing protein [Ignavibacterium sp.]|nr:MAG: rhodanese-like domain-containing protein [Ignavibacterium sp.]
MSNQFKFLIASILILYGCLEDITPPPFTGELTTTAEMLLYFESNGDFINSNLAPPLADAEDVNINLDGYLVIDLRNPDDYLVGHIRNAINKSSDSLYSFVEENHDSNYTKVILVSKNGQSSAYFASLLRLAGFNKVLSLKYGMASWNRDFADSWLNTVGDSPNVTSYTNEAFPKNEFTDLPQIIFADPNSSVEENIKLRIEEIVRAGFNFNKEYILSISILNDDYLICYGKSRLYNARISGTMPGLGHPDGTVSYEDSPFYHFRSTEFLQTLPLNQKITVYGYNGQLSAGLVAYLRVLGYSARTHLFGGNKLFYTRMIDDQELFDYAFSDSDINNFEYETGN